MPTYFFSTSGGRTEDVENTSLGTAPKPWLKSVVDKYDSVSPKHRWGPIRMGYRAAGRKLRGLVKGRFKGIKVVRRGSSPRVVEADVIGSRGRTRVDGATLRARFGLFDSWVVLHDRSPRTRPAASGAAISDAPHEPAAARQARDARCTAAAALQPHVDAERERLGDADRLVAALALERALDRDLRAAGDRLELP